MKRYRVAASSIGFVCVLGFSLPLAHATATTDQQISAHETEITLLNQKIAQYEAEITKADADKKTLQDAINVLELKRKAVETQVQATQTQINSTQLQIKKIGASISDTEDAIAANQAALAEDLRGVQQIDDQAFVATILSATTLADAWRDTDAAFQIQDAIQGRVADLQTQRDSLAASQASSKQKEAALSSQKTTLSTQQRALTQTKNTKTQLLQETNAQESTYQQLLAQAKKELASFSAFAQNAGGSGLLSNQTSCDSWGCYYNQRDTQWGNDPLNGTKYQLKSDGCLVTSMAMVMTHYGYRDVTPITINSDPSNFAAYFPAYMLLTIHVDGMTVTRKAAYINATLNTGNPVIVGIYAYGGTHYVVLTKRSGGGYLMRDPYIPNAKDVSFSAHYSLKNVFGVRRVVIQ